MMIVRCNPSLIRTVIHSANRLQWQLTQGNGSCQHE
jgi:hypothetical protein